MNIFDVHVHVVAAIKCPRADVADKHTWHRCMHCAAMTGQVGVFCELCSTLVALKEALDDASCTGGVAEYWTGSDGWN